MKNTTIAAIIGGIVIIGLLAFFLLKKEKEKEKEKQIALSKATEEKKATPVKKHKLPSSIKDKELSAWAEQNLSNNDIRLIGGWINQIITEKNNGKDWRWNNDKELFLHAAFQAKDKLEFDGGFTEIKYLLTL